MFHAHESRLARDYLALLARHGLEAGPLVDVGPRSALEACLAGEADVAVEWVELGVQLCASAASQGRAIRSFSFADAGTPGYLKGFVAWGETVRRRATHGTRPFDPALAFDAAPREWALSRQA